MRKIVFILLLPFAYINIYAVTRSNGAVADSLFNATAEKIYAELINKNVSGLFLANDDAKFNKYFETSLIKISKNIKIYQSKNDSISTLKIRLSSNCLYGLSNNSRDTLSRKIILKYDSYLSKPGLPYSIFLSDSLIYMDLVSRDEIFELNNGAAPIDNSEIPKRETTFWEQVIEPAAYIGSAALTVFLFFTVRSR